MNVEQLIDEWRTARAALRMLERSEHPDIVDQLGRTWEWIGGDLYRHDKMAWPRGMVERAGFLGWPRPILLDNPNYQWCDACRQHMIEQRDAR